nr:NADH dehydrogenase subunit 2 [Dilophus febrilis]
MKWSATKLFFLFFLIISTLISISSNSWFSAWMGLEINLLSFIPLMINSKNQLSSESSLKYFLIQAFASSLLLYFILFFYLNMNFFLFNEFMSSYKSIFISIPLMIKIGMAPFHYWFPSVMDGISWINAFYLMTWQKIAPMILMMNSIYLNNLSFYLYFFILISIVMGTLGGLNQTSLRKIMAFSSINHLAWMLLAMIFNDILWLTYFLLYSFLILSIVFFFNMFNLSYINQMYLMFSDNNSMKIYFMINFLSLGGLPPFLGFAPKFLIIETLMSLNYYFILTIFIIMNLITLYFYLRISLGAFLIKNTNNIMEYQYKYNPFIIFLTAFLTFISFNGLMIVYLFIFIFI